MESYAKMRGACGKLCPLATLLKTAPFDAAFEVFVWRGSMKNPKKLIVPLRHDYVRQFEGYQYAHSVSQNGTCNFNPHFGVAYAYFFAKLVHFLQNLLRLQKETECVSGGLALRPSKYAP